MGMRAPASVQDVRDRYSNKRMEPRIVNKFLALAASLLATLLATGCASTPPIGQSADVTVADLSELPAPDEAFLLRPLDRIGISVFGQEEFNRDLEISPDGDISLPLVGRLQAAGLSPMELETRIENQLRDRYIRNPSVSVRLDRAASQQVYVGGQVKSPGGFAYRGELTLQRVINLAGGVTVDAKKDDVLVQREVDGVRYIGVYNITAIERGNYEDPRLYPGDNVIVGDSPNRRRLATILGITSAVLQPLVLIERIGVI